MAANPVPQKGLAATRLGGLQRPRPTPVVLAARYAAARATGWPAAAWRSALSALLKPGGARRAGVRGKPAPISGLAYVLLKPRSPR